MANGAGTVMIVEDDGDLREALCDTLELAGYDTIAANDGDHALDLFGRREIDLIVSDIQMDGLDGHQLLSEIKGRRGAIPVLLMTAYGSIDSAVRALRAGASDYLVKPFEAEVLVSKVGQLMPSDERPAQGIVAVDDISCEVFALAKKVAASDATVMITGESGTGKEVLFRYLHTESPRHSGPAIAVNCAAIPENMLEAMLFGHEKGAFTGAHKACAGKFEQAQGGSLLLDEVSEMTLPLQAKLLRVLQEREVERLGGNQVIELDVRVIATSNRDLKEQVDRGEFREDLYYRLNVFPIRMPSLRERRADIVPLAEFFAAQAGARFSEEAQRKLQKYDWPGNVRELQNIVQRALIVHDAGCIEAGDVVLGDGPAELLVTQASGASDLERLGSELKAQEARTIIDALQEGRGSRKFAAERLGLSPRTLRYKVARLREQGIEIPDLETKRV